MPFLTLNGIEVKCLAASGMSLDFERLGERGRSFNGSFRKSERAKKRARRFRAPLLTLADSRATQGLVEGLGHHFPLEADLYADTGLGPAYSTAVSYQAPGSLANHGNFLRIGGSAADLAWDVGASAQWTWLASLYRPSPIWRRFLYRSDGARWFGTASPPTRDDTVDGRIVTYNATLGRLYFQSPDLGATARANSQVRAVGSKTTVGGWAYEVTIAGTTAADAPTFTQTHGALVVDGTVTWRCLGEALANMGDLAFLPYAVPDSWVTAMHAYHLASPWSALPALVANGDAFGNVATLVLGEVTNVEAVEFQSAGAWTPGESVEFSLFEV